ncbi:phage tail sheath C-terminal domain-containing protein [Francisella sp. SYW-9]|uniref:phage tail sheath C-terminal domain-containing protein n=1 Tax=Francisella sp. SYW-9 TaxID=2610888 RepID=UPI00123D9DD0|nr:phage tail sheath C-terminal domain-containing protein [Francisella sp. SYW-9]
MSDNFFHGVDLVESDSGVRNFSTVNSSVIGLVGISDDADATEFPLNTPTLIEGNDQTKISKIGTGELADSITGIFASGVGALVVVVRVASDNDQATQIANIIGTQDAVKKAKQATPTGRTGIYALLDSQSVVGFKPKLLIVPNYSSNIQVIPALQTVAENLKAIAIIDGTNTNDADVIALAKTLDSPRLYMVDPYVKVSKDGNIVDMPSSSYIAGHIVKIDTTLGWHYSPSNHVVSGVIGTSRPINYDGSTSCQANVLNLNNITTIIHQNGYRLWGNNTLSSDPKWQFLCVRRTADMINESIILAQAWAVDRGITKTFVDDVCMAVNNYLRTLKQQERIIDGNCWAEEKDNQSSNIAQGDLTIRFDFTPIYPAQHITMISQLTNGYLTEIFE